MPFSITQYETAVRKVAEGTHDLRSMIPRIGSAASAAMTYWYLPDFVKNAIRWCADQLAMLLKGITDTIFDLLKGAVAPVRFFVHAYTWQDVRGQASVVSGTLKDTALSVDDHWSGSARDAYVAAIGPQSAASDRIATIANRTSQSLTLCAIAGLAFYVALGFIVAKLAVAAVAAIAAFGSGVFSWAGAALVFEEASIDAQLVIALVTALILLLGVQATEMTALHGEAVDMSMFPGRAWPDPATGTYRDATVKDGDADWSLRRQ